MAKKTSPPSPSKPPVEPPDGTRDGEWVYDAAAAQRVVDFFAKCVTHAKGPKAGQPLVLDEWQERDIIRPTFGWKSAATGVRRYRVVYVRVPRKNGKSTLCAGIALYLTVADRESGAEVYGAAADKEQASIVFNVAAQMVQQSEQLRTRLEVFKKSMVHKPSNSAYIVLSSDAFTKHGFNASGVIVDEVHAQRDRELIDVLHTSTGARSQPLEVYITTAGYDKKSICWEYDDYACKVRDGVIVDPKFLPVIYGAGEDDDWTDPAVWAKANPGLGMSVRLDYLADECEKAKQIPAYENTFKRLHLNIWTEQATRWLSLESWQACKQRPDESVLHGRKAWMGVDLSSTTDITAVVMVVQDPDDPEFFDIVPRFFVPHDNIDGRERRDRVPYSLWVREGLIEATPGNVVDYAVVRKRIVELGEQFNIVEIAIDRWNSQGMQTDLSGDGFTVVPFGQGFVSMSGPSKDFERKILAKQIRHDGNAVLQWMLTNVAVQQDAAGNLKPAKHLSTERIDGIVALIMGLGRAIVSDGGNEMPKDYELLVL